MRRAKVNYGKRGRLNSATTGIRHPAPTFGRAKHGTFCVKANGHINVESDAERFTAQMLSVDPRAIGFAPQPFCVDLIEQRLLFSKTDVQEANKKYRDVAGAKFYTPDFAVDWEEGQQLALEVKMEGFEGDESYWEKIERARPILAANCYQLRILVMPADTTHPLRINARALKQATHQLNAYLSPELMERVVERTGKSPITVGALCTDLDLHPGLIPLLLVSGLIGADLGTNKINGMLEVSLAYGDLSHLCLLEGVER